PVTVLGVSYSGELAYELHVPNENLQAAYLALRRAGEPFGLSLFGARAVESMRMEMGFLHWKADILTEFDPFETGLGRFVRLEKADFVGKDALARRAAVGPRKRLVTLALDCDHAPAHGGASVRSGEEIVGTVTSAAWGHRTGLNLAYAFVDPSCGAPQTKLTVDVMGDVIPARVIPPAPYDRSFNRIRS
ncbi:MAG: glycine cleavage T C-terminal barrel domain-containing protein, partial [Pseudomonadota bacterium]